jgi:hypothetical protein
MADNWCTIESDPGKSPERVGIAIAAIETILFNCNGLRYIRCIH